MPIKNVRLIGGPCDGTTIEVGAGFVVEVMNPDKDKWGPTEFLAYAYEERDGEIVAVYPTEMDEKIERLKHIAEGENRGFVPKGTLQLAIDDEFRDMEPSSE